MAYGVTGGKTTGFASPAQGYEETNIDLNAFLIQNPSATYLFKLDSSDMADLGLPKGALLIVDRSKKPRFNQLAIIRHEGQFLCRLMVNRNRQKAFTNGVSEIIPISDETEIVGAVTASIQVYNHDLSH